MKIDAGAYNVTIRRVEIDGEALFEARVRELPDVIEYGESHEEAYQLAIDTIETAAQVYRDEGRRFPQPHLPQEDFSGRITLRLPKSLHRQVADIADRENVSLNQLIASALSLYVGSDRAQSQLADWRTTDKKRSVG